MRLSKGEVLVGGILGEIVRPALVRLYQQAGFDFVYIEYEHVFFSPTDLADTVLAARDNDDVIVIPLPSLVLFLTDLAGDFTSGPFLRV